MAHLEAEKEQQNWYRTPQREASSAFGQQSESFSVAKAEFSAISWNQ